MRAWSAWRRKRVRTLTGSFSATTAERRCAHGVPARTGQSGFSLSVLSGKDAPRARSSIGRRPALLPKGKQTGRPRSPAIDARDAWARVRGQRPRTEIPVPATRRPATRWPATQTVTLFPQARPLPPFSLRQTAGEPAGQVRVIGSSGMT